MSKGYVCFTRPGTALEFIDSTNLNNKSVQDIRLQLHQENNLLGIRYGTFQESIDDNIILLESYPLILQDKMPNKYRQPEYTLLPISLLSKNTKWIYANVNSNSPYEIPKFLIQILPEQMNLSIDEFLPIASGFLDIENSPIKFTADNVEIQRSRTVQELFQEAKSKQITFHCTLANDDISKIQKRALVVSEIMDTESNYISTLETITNFWVPGIRSKKLLTDQEMEVIIKEIPKILKVHQDFLTDFKNNYDKYATEVAILFIKYSEQFQAAIPYISKFSQISDLFNEKTKTNSFRKALLQLAERKNGTDILSFLVNPVQRYPRYALLIRDITKSTPMSHPDSFLIKDAANSMDAFIRKSDIESKKVTQLYNLEKIDKNLLNDFTIKSQNRELIDQFDVSVKGHHANNGVIYVFSDIILLTKVQDKGVSALFDCPVDKFHYIPSDDLQFSFTVASIGKSYNSSLMQPRKEYIVTFKQEVLYKKFMAIIKTVQNKISKDYDYSLDWNVIHTTKLSAVAANSATANGTEFFFFGGQRDNNRVASNTLTAINQFTNEFEQISVHTTGRFGHTMTLIGSRLFIIGGKSKLKFYKKVLCYDLKTNMWLHLIPNTDVSFTPRYGHTSTVIGERIFIFGGKNDKDEVLNLITIFDPFSNTFVNVTTKGSTPQPRYHHSANNFNGNMIVHGGKGKNRKLLSDTWILDTQSMAWKEVFVKGTDPVPRKCHSSFVFGTFLVIVQGVTSSQNSDTFLINVATEQGKFCHDTGNFPDSLRKFASFVDRQGKFYVYGGLEKKSKIPSKMFFVLTPNEKWQSAARKDEGGRREMPKFGRQQRSKSSIRRPLYNENEPDFDSLFGISQNMTDFDLIEFSDSPQIKKASSMRKMNRMDLDSSPEINTGVEEKKSKVDVKESKFLTPTKMIESFDFSTPKRENEKLPSTPNRENDSSPEKFTEETIEITITKSEVEIVKENEKIEQVQNESEKNRIERENIEKLENERKEKENLEKVENERKERENLEQIENERKERENIEKLENERKERENLEKLENERKEKENLEKLENERKEKITKENERKAEVNKDIEMLLSPVKDDKNEDLKKEEIMREKQEENLRKNIQVLNNPVLSVKKLTKKEEKILTQANKSFSTTRSLIEVLQDLNIEKPQKIKSPQPKKISISTKSTSFSASKYSSAKRRSTMIDTKQKQNLKSKLLQ